MALSAIDIVTEQRFSGVMGFLTPLPLVYCFAERLATAKEENLKIHATLDATLQDLNNF